VLVSMNKEKKTAYLKIALLILLFIACYGRSYLAYAKLHRNFDYISVRIKNQPVTKKQLLNALETMQEREESHIPEFAAYKITEHTMVGQADLERTTDVNLYNVYGQMRIVTPSEICAGNYPILDDYDGCVIDAHSAYVLFGSSDVLGQTITMKEEIPMKNQFAAGSQEDQNVNSLSSNTKTIDRNYIIRGVIQSEMPMVMIQTRNDSTEFWNFEFDYGDLKQGRQYAQQLMTYDLSAGKYVIIEADFMNDMMGNILVLPVFVIVLLVLISEVKKIHRIRVAEMKELLERHYRLKKDYASFILRVIRKSLVSIGKIVVVSLFMYCTWKQFGVFPTRYLPSKWSEFDQYIRFADQIKERLRDINYVSPTRREVLFKHNSMCCLGFGAVTLLLEWHILDLVRIGRNRQ